MTRTQRGREARHSSSDSDLDNFIMAGIFTFLGYLLFTILSQYLALFARYIYAPFTTPIWLAGERFNTVGSFSVILIYSIIGFAVWAVLKFKYKKSGLIFLVYGCLWTTIALMELTTGHKSSLMTASMRMYCNPQSLSLFAVFDCRHSVANIAQYSTLEIILASLLPNIILAAVSIKDIARGIGELGKHPKSVASRNFTIDEFIKDQKEIYPHLKLYDIINPNEIDGKSGQLRLMDNSRRLCFEHDLVKGFTKRPDNSSASYGKQLNQPIDLNSQANMPAVDMQDLVPVIDQEKFESLMLFQLGKVYSGVDSLNAGQIILLAIVLPRACSTDENMSKEEAEKINKEHFVTMDYVWDWVVRDMVTPYEQDLGLRNFDRLDEYRAIVEEWIEHPVAKNLIKKHAYINTLLYKTFQEAKRIGVCRPSGFRWLKSYDRELWALVQNVDRPSAFAENIAVVSHFLMEQKEGRAINQPMLQAAYNGLVQNVQKYKFPREKIDAWVYFKETGDKSLMRELNMVSKAEDAEYEYEYDDAGDVELEDGEYNEQ